MIQLILGTELWKLVIWKDLVFSLWELNFLLGQSSIQFVSPLARLKCQRDRLAFLQNNCLFPSELSCFKGTLIHSVSVNLQAWQDLLESPGRRRLPLGRVEAQECHRACSSLVPWLTCSVRVRLAQGSGAGSSALYIPSLRSGWSFWSGGYLHVNQGLRALWGCQA